MVGYLVGGSVGLVRSWKSAPLGRHDTRTAAVSRTALPGASGTVLLQLSVLFVAGRFSRQRVSTMFFVVTRQHFWFKAVASSWEVLNAGFEVPPAHIHVAECRASSRSPSCCQLTKKQIFMDAAVVHADDMA